MFGIPLKNYEIPYNYSFNTDNYEYLGMINYFKSENVEIQNSTKILQASMKIKAMEVKVLETHKQITVAVKLWILVL